MAALGGGAMPRRVMPGRSPALPWLLALAMTTAGGLGCSKKPAPGAATSGVPAGHVSGTPQTGDVLGAFKDAGLPAEGVAPLEPVPFGASYCEQGRVQGIDTLICEYADEAALDHGKQLIHDEWSRENVQTGVTATA